MKPLEIEAAAIDHETPYLECSISNRDDFAIALVVPQACPRAKRKIPFESPSTTRPKTTIKKQYLL